MESFPQGCLEIPGSSSAAPHRTLPGCLQGLPLASCKLWMNIGGQGNAVEPCLGSVCTIAGAEALAESAQSWKNHCRYPARTCEDSSTAYQNPSVRSTWEPDTGQQIRMFMYLGTLYLPLFAVWSPSVLCAFHLTDKSRSSLRNSLFSVSLTAPPCLCTQFSHFSVHVDCGEAWEKLHIIKPRCAFACLLCDVSKSQPDLEGGK